MLLRAFIFLKEDKTMVSTPQKPLRAVILCRGPTVSPIPKQNEWEGRAFGNCQL